MRNERNETTGTYGRTKSNNWDVCKPCTTDVQDLPDLPLFQGRNEVYGIRDQGPKIGWDPGSQPPGSGSVGFSLDKDQGFITQEIHDVHLDRFFCKAFGNIMVHFT